MAPHPHPKIVTPEALVARLRGVSHTVVQCHGCFDIVHPGHIRYLQAARQLGDVLVVSLTGDAAVAKGADRPYIAEHLRAENLAVLEFVDWVVIDPHPTAAEMLALLRPDVYVKGGEYARSTDPRFLRERAVVESYGGRVVFHSGDVVDSSTRLLQRLRGDPPLDAHRLRAFCERHGVILRTVRAALERIAGLRVLVVGDLVCERYVFCDAAPAEDGPMLAGRRLGAAQYWGGAAGLALQVQALGAHATLVSAAGRDPASQRAARRLKQHGVQIELLPVRPSIVTRTTYLADDTKVFQVTHGDVAPLDTAAERRATALVANRLADADAMLWHDGGYGCVTPGLVTAVNGLPKRNGVFVGGAAAGPRGSLLNLTQTGLLVAAERRAREAVHDVSGSLPSVVWRLLSATRGEAALIPLRKRGLLGFSAAADELERPPGAAEPELARLRSEFVPSLATHYADVLGAPEVVLACAALVRATGGSPALALYVATAAEALSVAAPGGGPVTVDALIDWLEERPELRAPVGFVAAAGQDSCFAAGRTAGQPLAEGSARHEPRPPESLASPPRPGAPAGPRRVNPLAEDAALTPVAVECAARD